MSIKKVFISSGGIRLLRKSEKGENRLYEIEITDERVFWRTRGIIGPDKFGFSGSFNVLDKNGVSVEFAGSKSRWKFKKNTIIDFF